MCLCKYIFASRKSYTVDIVVKNVLIIEVAMMSYLNLFCAGSSKVMFEHTMNFNTFTIRSFVHQFHNSDEVAREMVLSLHISSEASYTDLSVTGFVNSFFF